MFGCMYYVMFLDMFVNSEERLIELYFNYYQSAP